MRRYAYVKRIWAASGVNAYATSDIDDTFNGTYKTKLSAAVRSLMATTKFRYTPGNGSNNVTTLKRAVFALSFAELGLEESSSPTQGLNKEGTELPIANTLWTNIDQWSRSPNTATNYGVWGKSTGSYGAYNCGVSEQGFRPCFTLPSNATVDGNLNLYES